MTSSMEEGSATQAEGRPTEAASQGVAQGDGVLMEQGVAVPAKERAAVYQRFAESMETFDDVEAIPDGLEIAWVPQYQA